MKKNDTQVGFKKMSFTILLNLINPVSFNLIFICYNKMKSWFCNSSLNRRCREIKLPSIEITLRRGCCPVNLQYIFRTPFRKNTSGGLLCLNIVYHVFARLYHIVFVSLHFVAWVILWTDSRKNFDYLRSWYSLFQFNNENTRIMCEICSKLTIKTLERRQRSLSGVFIVNFEKISYVVLVFSLLKLNK